MAIKLCVDTYTVSAEVIKAISPIPRWTDAPTNPIMVEPNKARD